MQFEYSNLYHIYNRGNNKQTIFFNRENYLYFLKKANKYIYPNCNILAWYLMPNHFHLLIEANENSTTIVKENPIKINALTEGIRLLLSSYTQAINKQENRTGNLFQQKTKSKNVSNGSLNYGYTAFNYIHQNPVKANLVSNLQDWEFSSFLDYANLRNGKLCKKEIAIELFELNKTDFLIESYKELPDDILKNIF